jgi:membrane-anchored protein YejM (alkaline phosphatase superfamily)
MMHMTPVIGSVLQIHKAWAWVVIIANGLAGVWVLTARKVPSMRTRALWWFVIFAEIAVLVQILLGVEMITIGDLHAPFFHYFYGIVSLVAMALLLAYKSRLRRRLYLLYGLGSLFLMGLAIRAMIVVLLG